MSGGPFGQDRYGDPHSYMSCTNSSPPFLHSLQAFTLQIKEVLYHKKSQFQDILVFESENYGRVLVLDGVIQCTERDECRYVYYLHLI